ncbi:multidrug and toxin extrusion protein 1-like [Haliotis asinina]|uniref:multidrug and toxin extrusion protein 1-like n=1 Tax=Haliotis asinina TaxID=109174 RepID=UPI003531C704
MGSARVRDSTSSDEEDEDESRPASYRCLRFNSWVFSTAYKDELKAMLTLAWPVVFEVFGSSIMIGINSACDTLFPQTYGSTNKKNLGILLQRALLINMLASIPCIALYINVERILLAFGQNPDVSRLSGDYITASIPALPRLLVMSSYEPLF